MSRGFAQEALKSIEEEYYDFLSLNGVVERPTLGYRTLSDGVWAFNEIESFEENEDGTFTKVRIPGAESDNHIWKNNNLGTTYKLWAPSAPAENWFANGLKQGLTARIYGPEWFNSYNTAAPYGQNDGALWQGRGYNTSLTAGVRLEGYGFELTFKPQVSFSQNKTFAIMDNSEYYTNKFAYFWGYGNNIGVDSPQRFGENSFWNYDWGDSEVRWTWNSFTVGFGTQSPWLGPSWLNSIMHSNNAPTYPKFDIGLRKTNIRFPYFGWNLGSIEGRIWVGKTSESNYFDEDPNNDHNMLHGLSASYSPSFIPGLTVSVCRTCLVKWNWKNLKYVIPSINNYVGDDSSQGEDQRASISANWILPKIGFELYGEVFFDDQMHFDAIPNHARAYTVGLKQNIIISKKHSISSEILFEWHCTEMSQDFQLQWPYNFGFHYQITQGYTNKGQWLGAGTGYGGRSVYFGYRVYFNKGNILLFYQRWQPDNNYIYSKAIYDSAKDGYLNVTWEDAWKTYKTVGLNANYFVTQNLSTGFSFYHVYIINPCYYLDGIKSERNFYLSLSLKYEL